MRRSGNLALIKRKHNKIYKIFLIIPLSLSLILFYKTFDKYLLFVLKKNIMFTQYSFFIKISKNFRSGMMVLLIHGSKFSYQHRSPAGYLGTGHYLEKYSWLWLRNHGQFHVSRKNGNLWLILQPQSAKYYRGADLWLKRQQQHV